MSEKFTVEVSDAGTISVVSVGTQGVAGPNQVLSKSVNDVTIDSNDDGGVLLYVLSDDRWDISSNTGSPNIVAQGLKLGSVTVTAILDEDSFTSNSATALATQQSIKAYVDSKINVIDLDVAGDSGGTLSILDDNTLTISGGTGIDTSGSSQTLTVAIDSTVATLTDTQTLTNKTLTAPVLNTVDINGGDISSTTTINKSPTITLAGDLSGTATFTNLGDATLSATVTANSIELGTDTIGNYVQSIVAGEGIDVTTAGEGVDVTITAEEASSSNKGVASFDSTDFTVSSGAVTLNAERIQDLVGGMLSGNTENGISVSYEDTDGTIDFDVSDFDISLSGDVTGSATVTNLSNVTITTTIGANSVALGTDTTGNYVASLVAGTGVTLANNSGESATPTINIGQDVGTTDDVVFNSVDSNLTGNVIGAIEFDATASEALVKGDAVYISGVSGNKPTVNKADADVTSKMPSFGLVKADANQSADVKIITFGTLSGIDTSAFSVGDTLFISTTAGALTNTPPTGESSLIQNIGKVQRSHASAGSIKVGGAGRSNATPNLDNGNIFIGNGSNQSSTTTLDTSIVPENTNLYYTTARGE